MIEFFLENAIERKHEKQNSLELLPPTDEERAMLHNLFLNSKKGKGLNQ